MKLVNRNFALLMFTAIGLFSCKDDDKTTIENKFSIGENTYKITKGAFLKNTDPGTDANNNEYYRNELVLAGEGINLTTVDGELVGSGDGSFVDLLINNESRELEAGTYTWQSEENEQPFDLWSGYITIDWKKETEIEYELGSGTLTVTKSGDNYKATFEGIAHLEDGDGIVLEGSEVTVTFQFEGSLLEADRGQ